MWWDLVQTKEDVGKVKTMCRCTLKYSYASFKTPLAMDEKAEVGYE